MNWRLHVMAKDGVGLLEQVSWGSSASYIDDELFELVIAEA